MYYKSPTTGNEISCVMRDISDEILLNDKMLEDRLLSALAEDEFDILGKVSHKFSPQGYTIAVLLGESHVAIHTYPEYNSLYFNLYSCRGEHDGEKTFQLFRNYINPKNIDFFERDIFVGKNV